MGCYRGAPAPSGSRRMCPQSKDLLGGVAGSGDDCCSPGSRSPNRQENVKLGWENRLSPL